MGNGGAHAEAHGVIAASRLEGRVWMRLSIGLPTGASAHAYVVGDGSDVRLDETFDVSVGLSHFDALVSALIAVNQDRVKALQIGALQSNPNGCILSLFHETQLTQLRASLADVVNPVLSGFLNRGLSQMVNDLSDSLFRL